MLVALITWSYTKSLYQSNDSRKLVQSNKTVFVTKQSSYSLLKKKIGGNHSFLLGH